MKQRRFAAPDIWHIVYRDNVICVSGFLLYISYISNSIPGTLACLSQSFQLCSFYLHTRITLSYKWKGNKDTKIQQQRKRNNKGQKLNTHSWLICLGDQSKGGWEGGWKRVLNRVGSSFWFFQHEIFNISFDAKIEKHMSRVKTGGHTTSLLGGLLIEGRVGTCLSFFSLIDYGVSQPVNCLVGQKKGGEEDKWIYVLLTNCQIVASYSNGWLVDWRHG